MRGFISPEGVLYELCSGVEYEHHEFLCRQYGLDPAPLIRDWRREPLDAVYGRAYADGWILIGEGYASGPDHIAGHAHHLIPGMRAFETLVRVLRECPHTHQRGQVVELDLHRAGAAEPEFITVAVPNFISGRFVDVNPPVPLHDPTAGASR